MQEMNPLANSFQPKVTYADKLKRALRNENPQNTGTPDKVDRTRARRIGGQTLRLKSAKVPTTSRVSLQESSTQGENNQESKITAIPISHGTSEHANDSNGSTLPVSDFPEQRYTDCNGISPNGDSFSPDTCRRESQRCRPDDETTRGAAIAAMDSHNDARTRSQHRSSVEIFGFPPPATHDPYKQHHQPPGPALYHPGMPQWQVPGMFGRPDILAPGPYPPGATVSPHYWAVGAHGYPPQVAPPQVIQPYHPPYAAVSPANSGSWARPEQQYHSLEGDGYARSRPPSHELYHRNGQQEHVDAKNSTPVLADQQRINEQAQLSKPQHLRLPSRESQLTSRVSPASTPGGVKIDLASIATKDGIEQVPDKAGFDPASSTDGPSTRAWTSSESCISAQSPNSSLAAAELISEEIITGPCNSQDLDKTEASNKTQPSKSTFSTTRPNDPPPNAPKGPASNRPQALPSDAAREPRQFSQINKRSESGSWSQSKRWVSQETQERMAFQKMTQNVRHMGADKSPFIPQTPAELTAFKLELAEARTRELIVEMERISKQAKAKKNAPTEEKKMTLPKLELLNGKQLQGNLSPVLATDQCFNQDFLTKTSSWPTLAALKEDGDGRAGGNARFLPIPGSNNAVIPHLDYGQLDYYCTLIGLQCPDRPALVSAGPFAFPLRGTHPGSSLETFTESEVTHSVRELLQSINNVEEEGNDKTVQDKANEAIADTKGNAEDQEPEL